MPFHKLPGNLVSASVISIPCAVLASKLSLPEIEIPQTLGSIPKEPPETEPTEHQLNEKPKKQSNLMVALINGGTQGVKLAVGIAVLLIIVLGLEEIFDLALKHLPNVKEEPVTITRILGWFAWPFTVLIGL